MVEGAVDGSGWGVGFGKGEAFELGGKGLDALRALSNRLIGILHGCLTHSTPYNEHTARGHRQTTAA